MPPWPSWWRGLATINGPSWSQTAVIIPGPPLGHQRTLKPGSPRSPTTRLDAGDRALTPRVGDRRPDPRRRGDQGHHRLHRARGFSRRSACGPSSPGRGGRAGWRRRGRADHALRVVGTTRRSSATSSRWTEPSPALLRYRVERGTVCPRPHGRPPGVRGPRSRRAPRRWRPRRHPRPRFADRGRIAHSPTPPSVATQDLVGV